MNLLPEHASEIFHGALQIKQNEGRFLPSRFTDKQLAHYAQFDGYKLRSICCSGIKIVLRTDSPTIELDMDIESGCREYFALSFQLNGRFIPSLFNVRQPNAHEKWKFNINNTGEQAEIAIWLSHFRPSYFHAINIEDGCSFEPVVQPQGKLLCYGDSITQGMTSMHPMNTYTNVLTRLLDMQQLNQAIGGHVAEAASLDTDLSYTPDIITVAYGTNDWSRGFNSEEITANVEEYMQVLRKFAPETPVFWITPLWRNNMYEKRPNGNLLEFSEPIATAAMKYNATIIDGMDMLPHDNDYFFDGLHPNDIGGNIYGANVFAAIKRTLK